MLSLVCQARVLADSGHNHSLKYAIHEHATAFPSISWSSFFKLERIDRLDGVANQVNGSATSLRRMSAQKPFTVCNMP